MSTLVAGFIDSLWQGLEDDGESHSDATESTKDAKFPWVRLLVLADAYEEIGEGVKARVLRWCVRWKKRPWWKSPESTVVWYSVNKRLGSKGVGYYKGPDPSSDLPYAMFEKLPKDKLKGTKDVWVEYESLQDAFLSLADGLSGSDV